MTDPRVPNPTLRKLETVFAACDQLERQQPGSWGQTDLHRLVGGSLETLVPLRQLWARQQALRDQAPRIASTVLMAMASAVDQAMAQFAQDIDRAIADLMADRDDAIQSVLTANDDLREQLNEFRGMQGVLAQEADTLRTQLAAAHRTIDTEREALQAAHATQTTLVSERDQLATRVKQQTAQLAALTSDLEARNQHLADQQRELATLHTRIEVMTESHQHGLTHLQERHTAALDALTRDHRVAVLEAQQAERDAGQQRLDQATATHQQEQERLSREHSAREQTLHTTLTDARQRAALAEGQVALLSRQLDDQQQRLERQREEGAQAQAHLSEVIAFALTCDSAEATQQFLALWQNGDSKGIKRQFPGFKPAGSATRTR